MDRYRNFIEQTGNAAVEVFHLIGLFVIGGTIVWSAVHEYLSIMHKPYATLDDILAVVYLSGTGAMVGIFFRTHRLPVIFFLLFISMTALTRYLAIDLKQFDNYKRCWPSSAGIPYCWRWRR
ncbi:MAG: phosphate-starvation-inducible PsiE family protein [Thiolinea sp.]